MMDKDREVKVIALCQELVRAKSYSGQEDGVAAILRKYFQELGFDEVFTDHYGNIFGLIKEMQIDSTRIILEITESVFLDDYKWINELLDKHKNTGIRVAIDDFSTG